MEKEVVVTLEVERPVAEAEVISPEAAQPEEEAPAEMAQAAAAVVEETPTAMIGAAPGAPTAGGGEEMPTAEGVEGGAEAEAPAAEDVYQGTAAPTVAAAPLVEAEAAEPRAAAPLETATVEQAPTAMPEPTGTTEEWIALDAPPTLTPAPAVAEEAAEGVPIWLRLVEIGLGLMVIVASYIPGAKPAMSTETVTSSVSSVVSSSVGNRDNQPLPVTVQLSVPQPGFVMLNVCGSGLITSTTALKIRLVGVTSISGNRYAMPSESPTDDHKPASFLTLIAK